MPCFYCQSMITKSQFCHGGSVPDVGDLVKVILASVIIYCFDGRFAFCCFDWDLSLCH